MRVFMYSDNDEKEHFSRIYKEIDAALNVSNTVNTKKSGDSKYCVKLVDMMRSDNKAYLIYDYVSEGENLSDYLKVH